MSIMSVAVVVIIIVFLTVFIIYFSCRMSRTHNLEFGKHKRK